MVACVSAFRRVLSQWRSWLGSGPCMATAIISTFHCDTADSISPARLPRVSGTRTVTPSSRKLLATPFKYSSASSATFRSNTHPRILVGHDRVGVTNEDELSPRPHQQPGVGNDGCCFSGAIERNYKSSHDGSPSAMSPSLAQGRRTPRRACGPPSICTMRRRMRPCNPSAT